ncbi:hypothetical protein HPB48_016767 [Haemaphysalis longicornis]|uniref:Amino acid transporter n=1 Tax=Haemaphysalis longicornis TaxID=44386 RepID=A0A9J6FSH9_HAELO|nr:hypothetical protein HPB48_016767 [Haemaphysalis longicornis]
MKNKRAVTNAPRHGPLRDGAGAPGQHSGRAVHVGGAGLHPVVTASQLDKTLTVVRTYLLLTLAGLAAYGLVLLPGLYALVTGQDPRPFLRVTLAPTVKAFRWASRAVSVPDTIEALEEAADLEPRIVRFVIPVGANVSMSGTALVMSAAAVTLATLDGLELGPEELLIISLGAASIPNSGVLTVLMILMALEVSSRNISLVLVLDWLV